MSYVPPGRPRPAIGWSGSRRLPRVISTALAAFLAMLLVPGDVHAAGTLQNGSVTPGSGTTSTTFVFSVDYAGDPGSPATNVRALVAGISVSLSLAAGSANDGTFSGSSSQLPAGSWPVTFAAKAGGGDLTLPGPTVVVTAPPPTPTPSPTAVPTPRPTPRPTPPPPSNPPPTATARPTLRPASPTPAAPGATAPAGATALPAGSSPASPGANGSAPASASGESSSSPGASGSVPSASASSTEPPDPDEAASTAPRIPWLFVGGGMSALGAAILAAQWARRRRAGSTGP